MKYIFISVEEINILKENLTTEITHVESCNTINHTTTTTLNSSNSSINSLCTENSSSNQLTGVSRRTAVLFKNKQRISNNKMLTFNNLPLIENDSKLKLSDQIR